MQRAMAIRILSLFALVRLLCSCAAQNAPAQSTSSMFGFTSASMLPYAGEEVQADIYRIYENLPDAFYPYDDCRGIVVRPGMAIRPSPAARKATPLKPLPACPWPSGLPRLFQLGD